MRVALFTFGGLLLVCAVGAGQVGKKDAKPADGKEKKEPEIKEVGGKTLQQWTKEFGSKDPSKREHAMRMVMMFPPSQSRHAVGTLLDELKKHKATQPIDLSVRISGCVALGTILGSLEKLDKDDIKHVDEAVALLRKFCKDTQVIVRTRAIQAIGRLARFGEKVTSAIPEAILVANDLDTWEARQAGLETLSMLAMMKSYMDVAAAKSGTAPPATAPPAADVWNTFYKRMHAPEEHAAGEASMEVRLMAVKSIANFTRPPMAFESGSVSERTLLKNVEKVAKGDPEPAIRIWGNLLLMTIQRKIDKEHLQPIAKFLNDPNPSLRMQATQSLGMIGGQLQMLKRAKERPKDAAKIGEGVEKFIFDSLVLTLRDSDLSVVGAGIGALAQSDPALAVGPVADMLRRKEPGLKAEAAKVLAAIGKQAEPGTKGSEGVRQAVANALQPMLNDSDPAIIAVSMNALAHADPADAIAPVINILLTRKEAALRAEAAKVLGVIFTELREKNPGTIHKAEEALLGKLKDPETNVVVNCISALVQMDSTAALPALENLRADMTQQEVVKDAAAQAVTIIREHMNAPKKQPKGKAAPN